VAREAAAKGSYRAVTQHNKVSPGGSTQTYANAEIQASVYLQCQPFLSAKSLQPDYNPKPRYPPIAKNGHFLSVVITAAYARTQHVNRFQCPIPDKTARQLV
jgi:hypothetical protein